MSKIIFPLFLLMILCCQAQNPVKVEYEYIFKAQILDWYEGHRAAVSISYDAAWGMSDRLQDAVDEVIKRNLRMDFEMVTGIYEQPKYQYLIEQMRNELIPKGIHFFGHGHLHIDHDGVGFDSAYASFKKCYDLMQQWGFHPKVYAYPGSCGRNDSTQLANKLAGFIAARVVTYNEEEYFICPDSIENPDNWYYLPSIPVAYEYENYIQSHLEMAPILETALEKSAWVIIMYHNIGLPGGWGYYPFDEFTKDLDQIAENDFWCANMDQIAAYIQEKNKSIIEIDSISAGSGKYIFEIGLNNYLDKEIFNQPLTIEIRFNPILEIKEIALESPNESAKIINPKEKKIHLNMVPNYPKCKITFRL